MASARWRLVLCALACVVSACASSAAATPSATDAQTVGGHAAGLATATPAIPLAIGVHESVYGHLVIATAPGASCEARTILPSGTTVIAGDFLSPHTADASGLAAWSYRTPVAGAGSGAGHYAISCAREGETAELIVPFEVSGS